MSETRGRLAAALADRYRIERELGQGGMATVYLANDAKRGASAQTPGLPPAITSICN